MTAEQYNLLVQYASDFRSAMYAYEEEYGVIDLKADPISDIVAAGAKLVHIVDSLELANLPQNEDPF